MNHLAISQADGFAEDIDPVASRVVTELAAVLDLDRDHIAATSRLWEDFRVQAHDLIGLKQALQAQFSLGHIPAPEIDKWKTVGNVIAYVQSRLASEAITS